MPGFANWRILYADEYEQLTEEGYPVEEHAGALCLPLPDSSAGDDVGAEPEARWEAAYRALWSVREKGLRADFSYNEPTDYEGIIAAALQEPACKGLSDAEYAERIKGAWFGRCAGVVLGKPLEMRLTRSQIEEYLRSVDAYPLCGWVPARSEKLNMTLREDCVPSTLGHVSYVQPDDDVHYTVLALLLAEKRGGDFTPLEVGINWMDNVPFHWFWYASRQIYYHMVNMTDDRPKREQAGEMNLKLNPWRECIDGQLRGDLWGYINPAAPLEAARYACRDCSLSLVKNGVYGGMFVAGCISAALSENPSVETILAGGFSAIPANSRLAEAAHNVVLWYAADKDWIKTCDRIYKAYGRLSMIATVNNIAVVTLALLHGGLDYGKTITTAVMAGLDTDCNAGTAGSIVGAAIGYDRLGGKWVDPLNDRVMTNVADFGEGSISSLAERTVRLRERFKL